MVFFKAATTKLQKTRKIKAWPTPKRSPQQRNLQTKLKNGENREGSFLTIFSQFLNSQLTFFLSLRKLLLNLSPCGCSQYLQGTIWHGSNDVTYSCRLCSIFGKYIVYSM